MRNIVLLGLVSLLTDISTEMVYPLLPFYLTLTLGASPAVLGLVEGLAESVASLLKVVSGRVSDRLRQRKALAIAGYSASTVGKLILYLAGSWGGVLAGRLADRFGKGIRTAPRDALVAESSPAGRTGWAFGLHRTMDTLGAAAGALLAWALFAGLGRSAAPADFRSIFLVSLVPAFLGVVTLFWVRETARAHEAAGSRPAPTAGPSAPTAEHAGPTAPSAVPPAPNAGPSGPSGGKARPVGGLKDLDPRLVTLLVVTGVFTLGNSSNQFILLRAGQSLGTSAALLVYVLFNAVYALVSWPAGGVADRIGKERVLILGFLMYAAVYGALAVGLGDRAWAYVLIFALYGVYSALTEGVAKALVADLSPPDLKATVLGLHATIVGLGLLPASLIAGLLWAGFGPWAAFGVGSLAGLLAAAGLAFGARRRPGRVAVGDG